MREVIPLLALIAVIAGTMKLLSPSEFRVPERQPNEASSVVPVELTIHGIPLGWDIDSIHDRADLSRAPYSGHYFDYRTIDGQKISTLVREGATVWVSGDQLERGGEISLRVGQSTRQDAIQLLGVPVSETPRSSIHKPELAVESRFEGHLTIWTDTDGVVRTIELGGPIGRVLDLY